MILAMLAAAAAPLVVGNCYAAAHALPAGAILSADDIEAVQCQKADRPPLRYDFASGAPVTVAAINQGAYLGRLAPLPQRLVALGETLTLRSTAGVVTIERQVTAVQAGRSGGRVFVRASSGEVFSVPLVVGAR